MKTRIATLDRAIEERKATIEGLDVNHTFFWAYKKSLEAGNDLINFYDVIWDNDIEGIVKTLNSNGINEFSISSNFSGLITTLAEFDKYGFTMANITEAKETYYDFATNERAIVKAIRMIRK